MGSPTTPGADLFELSIPEWRRRAERFLEAIERRCVRLSFSSRKAPSTSTPFEEAVHHRRHETRQGKACT